MIWSTRTGKLVEVSNNELALLKSGSSSKIAHNLLDQLQAAGILVNSNSNELNDVLDENESYAKNDPEIDIIIVPSSNCPLGCNLKQFGSYCGQVHTRGALDPALEPQIRSFIERSIRPFHKKLKITWFGGEPLLALQQMRTLSGSLSSLATERGLRYAAALVTSGTLFTPPIARECHLSLGVESVSITIDGNATNHNLRRPTKAGHGTFEKIDHNLAGILADPALEQLIVSIRCNVDSRNIKSPDEVVDHLIERGWQDRVEVYVANVHPWGDADSGDMLLSPEAFSVIEVDWHRRLAKEGIRTRALPPRKRLVCRVVSASRLVIGHDGTVHRCTESPLTPKNVQKDNLGSITNWPSLEAVPRWAWHEAIRNHQVPCSKCEYLPVCGGACPLSWNSGSDVPCPPFKFNGAERVRLAQEAVSRMTTSVADAVPGHSVYSILGMLSVLPNCALKPQQISKLDHDLRKIRQEFDQIDPLAAARILEEDIVLRDWNTTKIVMSARLSTAAFLYYKSADYGGVARCTERVVRLLKSLAEIPGLDARLAQAQALINLMAVALKLHSTIDNELMIGLGGFLRGAHALNVQGVRISRLQPEQCTLKEVRQLRQSVRAISEAGSVALESRGSF